VANQDDVMNKLASFKLISVFDARAGYWQTPVKPENQWLLGFATHHGLWQWTRTPLGAKNSGSTFIRAMQVVLKPLQDINANYVDDMGVGSHSWPSHLVNLRRYLNAIKTAGVTLKFAEVRVCKTIRKVCRSHYWIWTQVR
jgi:Reverse transcriptase (RNA-dependent DNA polymerase)